MKWDIFMEITDLDLYPAEKQVAVLKASLSDETLVILENFELTASEACDITQIVAKLKTYACGIVNQAVESYHFNMRNMYHNESFDEFFTALKEKLSTCDYPGTFRDCQ